MMFYFLSEGKPQGPVSELELKQMVQNKQLGPFDLIFVEGGDKWQTVKGYTQFSGLFKSVASTLVKDPVWIVLKQIKGAELKKSKQDGPFTIEQIKNKLREGGLSFDDFVWTDGMSDWYRIGHLEDFSLVERKTVDVSDLTDPSIRLGDRPSVPSDGNKPIRVLRLKKVKPVVDTKPVSSQSQITFTGSYQTGSITKTLGGTPQRRPTKKKKEGFRKYGWAELFLAVLILIGGSAISWLYLTEFRFIKSKITAVSNVASEHLGEKPAIKPAPDSSNPTKEALVEAKNEDVDPNESIQKPPHLPPATMAKIFLMGVAPQQKIKLSGNGAFPNSVRLRISALAGDVVGFPRIDKVSKVKLSDEDTVLFSQLKLPPGRYTIQLVEPQLEAELTTVFGVRSMSTFRLEIQTYRKQIIASHIAEKAMLGQLFGSLDQLKVSAKDARELIAISRPANGKSRLHEPIWREIEELAKMALATQSRDSQIAAKVESVKEDIKKVTIFRRL